jgi:hypothetical protein
MPGSISHRLGATTTWPFGVVEAIWALIAVRRYRAESHPSA